MESIWRRYRHYLGPLGKAYGAAMKLRSVAYERGLLSSQRAALPIVSVGNLRLGGTGKTPFVEWLTRELASAGLRPAIVSRGYGRHTPPSQLVVVSDGATTLADAQEGGDEPLMLARALRGVPVVVCSDRFRACEYIHRRGMAECVVLDDGFQHLALARDFDVVIVDGGICRERVFPAGELREPLSALARAHAFVFQAQAGHLTDAWRSWLEQHFPGRVLVEMHRAPGPIHLAQSTDEVAPEALKDTRLLAFAGIAHPQRFFAALHSLGFDFVEMPFEDHAHYAPERLTTILQRAEKARCAALITTAKDAVKLPPAWPAAEIKLYILREKVWINPAEVLLERLRECLRKRLMPSFPHCSQ
ncbi:MAG: tetraacyldisaccharide 4'-kinase [Candidatus Sumerlaeaceae bacterium]|nr:tetraacyldisaccharide 4'-kinase [Candidatus Sumerlaeaceae bacterium]